MPYDARRALRIVEMLVMRLLKSKVIQITYPMQLWSLHLIWGNFPTHCGVLAIKLSVIWCRVVVHQSLEDYTRLDTLSLVEIHGVFSGTSCLCTSRSTWRITYLDLQIIALTINGGFGGSRPRRYLILPPSCLSTHSDACTCSNRTRCVLA